MIESNPNVQFTLTSRQTIRTELLSVIYAGIKNVKMLATDIYSYGFTTEKYDLIVCIPIFGGRILINGEDFISREPDLIAMQNLLYHINMDGNLVMVLPAKITFGGDSTASLREYIERNYKIKEISALPAGLFTPYTSIRTYMFVFSTGRTDDVVLKQYESDKPIRKTSPCKNLVVKNEILLFSDEFAGLNGWIIDMAFSEEDEDIKAFFTSPVKKLRLKDAATVFRGKAINAKAENGNVAVINISNITDTGIDYENLDQIEEEERKVSRYILEGGDVLVTARGTTIKIAVFEKQQMICIPSANINVDMLRGAYPKTKLVIIDTLQKVRDSKGSAGKAGMYGNDYDDISSIKRIADDFNISIILVHHLRKLRDGDDPFNEVSGSTGIIGATDTNFILKCKRSGEGATLLVSGRDVEYQELTLQFHDLVLLRYNKVVTRLSNMI